MNQQNNNPNQNPSQQQREQTQRGLGDNAQHAFAADKQTHEIKAGLVLVAAASCLQLCAVREHCGQERRLVRRRAASA